MRSRPGSPRVGAEAQAERIASLMFLAGRGGQLLFSTLMVANDRRHYARPLLQAAALAGVWLESGWLTQRLIRAHRYDDRAGMWIDTVSAAGALLVSQRGLGTDAAAPWAKNVAIGAAIGAASTRRPTDAVGAVATLCSAAIATGLQARGRDTHVAGLALALNDAVSWTGMHVAARVYLNAHRRYARLSDEADALTVDRAAAAASEAERSRQHELLHRVTIDVLGRIADGTDLRSVTAVARAEAARLRYALRTGGRIPQGLDEALAELAEQASRSGMRVELVTAELDTSPPPEATAALRAAAIRALIAARDLGGASRAVVRALSTDDSVSVTVRDHGHGFTPGAGSDYEAHLQATGELLEPWGGTATLWSEPGGGVRMSLTVSAGAHSPLRGSADDATQRVPDVRLRRGSAGDHDGAVDDQHVDSRSGGGSLEGAQHQVGVAGAMVRITQFDQLPAAETRLADRTLLAAVLAWRVTGLATGAASLIAGGSRYHSRTAAAAQLAVAVGESAWFARRVLGGERWSDVAAARTDAATAAAVLVMGQLNLDSGDRSTWINWAPWSFAANVVCGQAMGITRQPRAALGAVGVIGVTAAQSQRPGDALANSTALAAFFGVSRSFASQIRMGAVRLENARREAVHEGRRLALARERSVQLRLLHDHALQTLETIAGGRFSDLSSVRAQARTEASKLDGELAGSRPMGRSFLDQLRAVLAEHTGHGLAVDLEYEGVPTLDAAMTQALCGACNEALTNVRKHAGTDRARVAVDATHGRVIVTIIDDGNGFDATAVRGGFGMGESIDRRMRDAGGAARTESTPGAGTRVTLSGPSA